MHFCEPYLLPDDGLQLYAFPADDSEIALTSASRSEDSDIGFQYPAAEILLAFAAFLFSEPAACRFSPDFVSPAG